MKTQLIALACAAVSLCQTASAAPQKGRVMFWYDTEDYVCPASHDGTLFHAKLLSEFGFRGNFAIVGFYAQVLGEQRRQDVIDALKPHCIGSQSLYHSRHPTICEYTDVTDWQDGYRRCLSEESECVGMLRATFGLDAVSFFVPPGTSVTPTAMYAYADMGVPVYAAGIDIFGDRKTDRLAWYANMLHLPYRCGMGTDAREVLSNDELAARNLTLIYTHPNEIVTEEWWDVCNYRGANLTPWREWKQPKLLSPEKQAMARRCMRELMTRIKNDPRLTVVSCDELVREIRPRIAIRRADVPRLLAAMEKGLEPVEEPASWCVSDIFQAAVAFLRGRVSFMPAKAWGFLERPVGVTVPTTLRRDDLVRAAEKLDTNGFVPPSIAVGDTCVGPADFLLAALGVLAAGAEEVTVSPRDQVGPVGKHLKNLPKLRLAKGWCIYSDNFKDGYVTNRLRWQFWTLRYE